MTASDKATTRPTRDGLRPAKRRLAVVAAALITLGAWPGSSALAQIGTPSTGPISPGGPRQGLGPPSITDNTPDLRLHAPGAGGIPGTGPPVDYGGTPRGAPRSSNPIYMPRYGASDDPSPRRAIVAYCRTARVACAAPGRARAGSACACRLDDGTRLRGRVAR